MRVISLEVGGDGFSVGGKHEGREKSHRAGPTKAGRDPATEQGHRDTEKTRRGDADKEQGRE